MQNPLLPRAADNTYGGYKIALWIFGAIVLFKAAIAAGVIFNGHTAAANADGIPLDTFGPGGAQAYLATDAAWGLGSLVLCTLSAVMLFRYRSLVPLMFTALLVEHVLRRVIFYVMPIPRVGAPPGVTINLVLTALLVAGLVLALLQKKRATARTPV